MPSRGTPTTLRVSRKVWLHIEEQSKSDESVNATVRRLLRMKRRKDEAPPPGWMTKVIRVDQEVHEKIRKKARRGESRDQTLGRLMGIAGHDGNVRTAAS